MDQTGNHVQVRLLKQQNFDSKLLKLQRVNYLVSERTPNVATRYCLRVSNYLSLKFLPFQILYFLVEC